ncbi:MAG: inorganic phosphate transporter [Actinophytocola sp.]|nr:inorganic phosphate transporter [Actinophytocola sp.]
MLLVAVVVTALVFDFTNGFHDTANSMATSIATGALRPKVAVGLSAVLNLVGAFLSVEVAKTISGGLVDDARIGPAVIFAGLIGAITWNLITWYVGLPSSSSHALFGGLIGATWIAAGSDAVNFGKIVQKILVPAVAAPLIAGLVAAVATYLTYRLVARIGKRKAATGFRWGQVVSASAVSLAHGTNDAQKTMGVITLTLISVGYLPNGAPPPTWVIVSAAVAIALGTYFGGWRIIHTMGKGLTELEGPQGFAAQTSSATVILAASQLGLPLSTTHACSGGIVGSGLGRRDASVRWGLAARMVAGWFMTLPSAAVIGAAAGKVASFGNAGVVVVAVIGMAIAGVLWVFSRRGDKHPHRVVEDLAGEPERTKI